MQCWKITNAGNLKTSLAAGLLLGGALLGTARSAAADATETEEKAYLPDMVVTATRTAQSTDSVPANVTVITAADIAQGNYTDVVSVLKRLGGIHFRSFSGNQEATADIRGFGVNSFGRVLILRDGRRLNRPDMRGLNWSQIPLSSVERIEILRGPAGAMYGDQAVGGVINIISKKGAAETTGRATIEGGTEDFNRQAIGAQGRLGDVDYALNLERSETAGWRERTGTRSEGGDITLGHDFSDSLRLDLNLNYLETDYEMPGGLTKAQFEADPRQAVNLQDEAVDKYWGISPTLTIKAGEHGQFIIDTGFTRKEITTDQVSWFSWTDLVVDTWTLAPRYVLTAPLGDLANQLTIGLDWNRELVGLERFFNARRTVFAGGVDLEKDTLGLYLNNALNLTDALIFSAGARVARSRFEVEQKNGAGVTVNDDDDTHREKAYHLGLTWNFRQDTKLFAKYERFFRLPFTDEQIAYSGFGLPAFNKNLVPETGDSYEVGVEQRLPRNTVLAATLFCMKMEDEIAFDFLSPSFNSNLDQTRRRGLELSATTDPWSFLTLHGNYTWLRAEFADGANKNKMIPLVPRHKLTVGAELRPLAGLRVNLDCSHTSRQYPDGDSANAGDQMAGYTVFDLGVAYAIKVKDTDWELFAGVDNLFDRHYTDFVSFGAWYPAPGRTYKAGLKVDF